MHQPGAEVPELPLRLSHDGDKEFDWADEFPGQPGALDQNHALGAHQNTHGRKPDHEQGIDRPNSPTDGTEQALSEDTEGDLPPF